MKLKTDSLDRSATKPEAVRKNEPRRSLGSSKRLYLPTADSEGSRVFPAAMNTQSGYTGNLLQGTLLAESLLPKRSNSMAQTYMSHGMISKRVYLSLIFCLVISQISFGCQAAAKQPEFSERKIISTLKEFYTEYISELGKRESDYAKVLEISQKHCTKRLCDELGKYSEIMVIDYDPFLNAQDFTDNFLKTLEIKKDSIRNDIYHISYFWNGYNEGYRYIELYIVKEGNSYKIDNVGSIIPLIENYEKEKKEKEKQSKTN
jgi:hypothetical protein